MRCHRGVQMHKLVQQLAKYAAYHRDPRNVATHFVGIPMIVLAVTVLLSRPSFELGWLPVSPALVAVLVFAVYYLRLDIGFGLVMSALLAACLLAGNWVSQYSTAIWLAVGVGAFVLGWVIQFIGHYFEGQKPAFIDDIMGLATGPLFVVAEFGFLFGIRAEVQYEIEQLVGPLRSHGDSPQES